ncbi:MAG: LD-carboxypeptidase [Candidatus Binatia bacterium]
MEVLKPAPLKRGDKIGVVAPSGAVDGERLNAGISALLRKGFRVELAEGIMERKGYLAGDKEKRAKVLEQFFIREDIRAIFCARGGFGSVQLLPLINVRTIRSHPKIFVGYSDVSVLLNWLVQRCGIVTFHGPMVAMEIARGLEGRTRDFFWGTLYGKSRQWQVQTAETVRPGRGVVQAGMIGGCLSTIVTTLGTPYEVQTTGRILFLEDIGEKAYRIERMLTHLKMAGKLEGVAGVVFGQFTDCGVGEERDIADIIKELFQEVSYPVFLGLAAGHAEENLLLPFGVRLALDGEAGVISLLESPTADS